MQRHNLVYPLMLAAWMCGCQGQPGGYETVRLPTDDYGRTFDAARDVLAANFEIEKADPADGSIKTAPKEIRPGEKVVPSSVLQPLAEPPGRRVARAWVTRADGAVRASVQVELWALRQPSGPRPVYDEQQPTTGENVYQGTYAPGPETWVRVGRDREMERKLLDQIERRLNVPTMEPKVPESMPPSSSGPG